MRPIRTTLGALAVAATALAGLPGAIVPAAAQSEYNDWSNYHHGQRDVPDCIRKGVCRPYDLPRWQQRQFFGGKHHYRDRHHYGRRHHERGHHRGHYRGGRVDDGAAAAIIGLTGLAIIGGVLASQDRTLPHTADPRYRPDHRAPRVKGHYPPAPGGTGVVTYAGALEPWSPGWYEWCDARYRSFDPRTGTYRGYDGRDHFCVPK